MSQGHISARIKTLICCFFLLKEQQFSSLKKEEKCKFSLVEYARRRGYPGDRIKKSGIVFEELKKDLFSGAYTTYTIDLNTDRRQGIQGSWHA